jgi:riboflavin synthase
MCANLAGMFTGIVTDIGEVLAREGGRFTLRSAYAADSIVVGASIACDGACLTATTVRAAGPGSIFTCDVSNETLMRTCLGDWQPGRRINLERALKASEELGGHIVSGHIDGVARLIELRADGQSRRLMVEAPAELGRYIASKGSVALDGVSLTVNEVDAARFGINIIPHTLTQTTLGIKKPGDAMNLEVDLLARYVARVLEYRQ